MKTQETTSQAGERTHKTLAQFIAEHKITMTAKRASSNPNMDDSDNMDHWFCTLQMAGRHMGAHFSTGLGLRKERKDIEPLCTFEQFEVQPVFGAGGNRRQVQSHSLNKAQYDAYVAGRLEPVAPKVVDVLDCLASDAAGMVNSGLLFEDWCSEYGYDTDSRKAEKTFNLCKNQAQELERFFGNDENYQSLLFEVEKL